MWFGGDVLGDTKKYNKVCGKAVRNKKPMGSDSKNGDFSPQDPLTDTKLVDRGSAAFPGNESMKAAPPAAKLPVKSEPPIADGVLFGPDGMPLDNNAVVEADEDGQLHAKISSHQKVESG